MASRPRASRSGSDVEVEVRFADGSMDGYETLAAVRRASRRVANAPEMAAHVPNVGTAVPDATDVTDVAATRS